MDYQRADIVIADDHRVWQPPNQLQDLWTTLRVAYLHAVWTVRCRRKLDGTPITAAAIVAMVVHAVRSSMYNDWKLVMGNLRTATDICSSWFRGKERELSMEDFKAKWGHREVLCLVQALPLSLNIVFTSSHPCILH